MAKIVSHTPGRVRVRLRPQLRRPEAMQRIRSRLEREPGVHAVETNPETGSVLVHYEHGPRSLSDLVAALQDVGVIFHDVSEGPGAVDTREGSAHSSTAQGIIGALDDLNHQLSLLTGHTIDLKLLFPFSLGALGVWQLARRGWGIEEVPAYVLLWYAFDSFYKLHREPGHEAAPHAAAPQKQPSANGASDHG